MDSASENVPNDVEGRLRQDFLELMDGKPAVQHILEYLSEADPKARETTVDELEKVLLPGGQNLERYEIVAALKGLGLLGFGKFVVGRWKNPSRIKWEFDPAALLAFTLGMTLGRPIRGSSSESQAVMKEHAFDIGNGLVAYVSAPEAPTLRQARALAHYLRGLAMTYESLTDE